VRRCQVCTGVDRRLGKNGCLVGQRLNNPILSLAETYHLPPGEAGTQDQGLAWLVSRG
jgi:hypothetical protein